MGTFLKKHELANKVIGLNFGATEENPFLVRDVKKVRLDDLIHSFWSIKTRDPQIALDKHTCVFDKKLNISKFLDIQTSNLKTKAKTSACQP